ncbi:hypothetical protein [Saccharopolyspora phatthalungensis]|uniref:Uncharacterized protein n=1 Tax=Saccharopolyspora phatthalungensis TaxID=664693 RepID=A0A840Q2F4_9PSEU|nr:hypothetical protein [Saccharopolyspora phatthalungensis]MBB5154177.1 hypothetical protein [Saccharopolyspora phatthalungensis]
MARPLVVLLTSRTPNPKHAAVVVGLDLVGSDALVPEMFESFRLKKG